MLSVSAAVDRVRLAAIPGGPLLALLVYLLLPDRFADPATGALVEFSAAGRATLGVMAWMALWWLTEAIDISATALLPLALFPVLGINSMARAAAPYANDLIFLFLGGFVLAAGMQRWSLDRRIALSALRLTGTSSRRMVLGFMVATAFLSMWVSNTATAAMMLPIAISLIVLVNGDRQPGADGPSHFGLALLLGVAYAASIGGIGTIIGSPPNGIAVEFIRRTYGRSVSFLDWMMIGLPFVIVFLPLTWAILVYWLHPPEVARIEGGQQVVRGELAKLGRLGRGERIVLAAFAVAGSLWILRPLLVAWTVGADPGATPPVEGWKPLAGLTDGGVAIIAALVLFAVPVSFRPLRPTLDWRTAEQLPWGVLILFGGGLSLAEAVRANGVAEFIGAQAASFAGIPALLIVLAVVAMIIFLTELTSNTATTATMVPLLAALAPGLGLDPYLLIVPATIAASCAFMMPVATPPNAMVFATRQVTIPQMCAAGVWLNLTGVLLITLIGYFIVVPLLG